MKVYEFENNFDNGETDFHFKLTKDINFFFKEEEKKDLLEKLKYPAKAVNRYLRGVFEFSPLMIADMYKVKYGSYKGLEQYIKLESEDKKPVIADIMWIQGIGLRFIISKKAKDYLDKKYFDYFRYIEVFYKDIPLYIITELTKVEPCYVIADYKYRLVDFLKISGKNDVFLINRDEGKPSDSIYCLEAFKEYIEASALTGYEFRKMNDSNTFKIPEEKKEELKEVEDKAYYENGNLKYKGLLCNGKRIKEWKYYYENGNLKYKGLLCNGKRIKEWKYYYENGNLNFIGSYDEYGEQTGVWKTYYENGIIKNIANYDFGGLVGLVKNFDEEGNYTSSTFYKEGSDLTKWQFFYKDGKSIEKEGTAYDMGEEAEKRWIIDGEWKYYNETGKLQKIETYENGEIIKVEKFK